MNDLSNYIYEKLHLNKDISVSNKEKYNNAWDANGFEVDDIVYLNPNYSGKKKVEGGKPEFFKITNIKGDRITIIPLDSKLVSGTDSKGEMVPIEDSDGKYKITLKILDGGFIYKHGKVLYLWDGTPEPFWT